MNELEETLAIPREEVILASAKEGKGIPEILEALVLTRNAGSTIRNGTQVWWSRELRRAARAAAQAAEGDGTGEG